jgi:DNA-binding LacI/PurR family transcriptional regulator
VSIDDEESARVMTHHLIAHGYRRIAHLAGSQQLAMGRERLAGFCRAQEEAGLECDRTLIVECGFHEDSGFAAMQRFLDLPVAVRPRAVVAINDPAAYGAIRAILERGLSVPRDIAVVGFSDDIRAPLMPVPLTTMRQPAYEMGRVAAERLVATIAGDPDPRKEHIVKTLLVVRRSCGCTPEAMVRSTEVHR